MSTYRRYRDGETNRWDPEAQRWVACPPDEPETRERKPTEGLIVLPAEKLIHNLPMVPIEDLLAMLRDRKDSPCP